MNLSWLPRTAKVKQALLILSALVLIILPILYSVSPPPMSFGEFLERLVAASPLMLPVAAIVMVWGQYMERTRKRLEHCYEYADVPIYRALFVRDGAGGEPPIAWHVENSLSLQKAGRWDALEKSLFVIQHHKDLYPRNLFKSLSVLPRVLRAYDDSLRNFDKAFDQEIEGKVANENSKYELRVTILSEQGVGSFYSYREKYEKEFSEIAPKLRPATDAIKQEKKKALDFLETVERLLWKHVTEEALGPLPIHYKIKNKEKKAYVLGSS